MGRKAGAGAARLADDDGEGEDATGLVGGGAILSGGASTSTADVDGEGASGAGDALFVTSYGGIGAAAPPTRTGGKATAEGVRSAGRRQATASHPRRRLRRGRRRSTMRRRATVRLAVARSLVDALSEPEAWEPSPLAAESVSAKPAGSEARTLAGCSEQSRATPPARSPTRTEARGPGCRRAGTHLVARHRRRSRVRAPRGGASAPPGSWREDLRQAALAPLLRPTRS